MKEKALDLSSLLAPASPSSLLALNKQTAGFHLTLSEEDAKALLLVRQNILKEQQRVEFGTGILPELVKRFCDSPYIYQENYVDTLARLQEIFYFYKNESMDELADDELLDFMKEQFDGICEGSLEYLESTALEDFARYIRENTGRFLGRYQKRPLRHPKEGEDD